MRFKEKVNGNIDPEYYDTLAMVESSGNPNAKASTSSASGIYQFTKGTWKGLVDQMGLEYSMDDRFDPEKSRKVVEEFTRQNYRYLKGKLNREVSTSELYLAHFLGMGGSRDLLKAYDKNPNMSVADVLGEGQIKANKSVFYNKDGTLKKVKDVYKWAGKKFGVEPEEYDFYNDPDEKFEEENKIENRRRYQDIQVADTPDYNVPTEADAELDLPTVYLPEEKEEDKTEVAEAKQSIDSRQNKMAEMQRLMQMNSVQYIDPNEKEEAVASMQEGGNSKRKELLNSDLNVEKEYFDDSREFLDDWIGSERFRTKMSQYIQKDLEKEHGKTMLPIKEFFSDDPMLDSNHRTDNFVTNSRRRVNETPIYMAKTRDYNERQEYNNKLAEAEEMGDYGKLLLSNISGKYSPEGDYIYVNNRYHTDKKDHEGTATHELTHSTALDEYFSNKVPQSQAKTDLYNKIKEKYPNHEILQGGLFDLPPYLKDKETGKTISSEQLEKEFNYDNSDFDYMDRSNEVYSRIMSIRHKANLDPNTVITKDNIQEIKEAAGQEELFDYYSDDQVIDMLNKLASNKQSPKKGYAKRGRKIKK